MGEIQTDQEEKQAVALYKHVKELSQLKYESELRREDSLIQQSSNMQTAFSFMTAAVFMASTVAIENRGTITLNFFFVSISSIIFFLLISLLTASLAQKRVKKEALMNIPEIETFVSENWQTTIKESQQLKQWVDVIGKVQKSLEEINSHRVQLIRISMWSFLASLCLVIFWFVVAVCKII